MDPIAIGLATGVGARPQGGHRSKLVLGIAVALAGVAVIGFAGFGAERLWMLHTADASLRSAIETGITLSALVSAVLLLAHFRQTRLLRDLLLLAALSTASLTDFVFNALPAYHYQTGIYGAGARMAVTVLISGTFLAVAFGCGQQRVSAGRRLLTLALAAAFGWVAFGELVDLIVGPVRAQGPMGDYRLLGTAIALTAFMMLVASARGFVERRVRGDSEAGLLAAAALLIAGGQLSKLALPVVPPEWVTPADLLRIGAFGLLLAASVRLYRRSQSQMARDAITAERLRIARDLHDGLAQDLAFIAAHSERLALEYGSDHPLAVAATRALAISRGKIVDLEASGAPSTGAALREVASDLASRFNVQVTVEVDDADPDRTEGERHELVRIAREAIANAARHGGARHISVKLGSRRDGLMLRVSDDGCGLAKSAGGSTAGTGLGLRTMRARARHIGANLLTGSGQQGGTDVDVVALSAGAYPEM